MNKQEAMEKAIDIFDVFFDSGDTYIITGKEESIPLVAANIKASTNSFTKGQLVYIFDGYWGMAEMLNVIGRYRMKHRLIDGHCAIKNVMNFRPKKVFNPVIIQKLKSKSISKALFLGFSNPEGPYIFKASDPKMRIIASTTQ